MIYKYLLPFLLFWLLLFIQPRVWSQNNKVLSIAGRLVDSVSGEPLLHVTVLLKNPADSSIARAGFTDEAGRFQLTGIGPGDYWMECSHLGHQPLRRRMSLKQGAPLDLGTLPMAPRDFKLDQVVVREDRIPITIKKDTLEYDAGAFKVRDGAVVEELLKKLPGVEVERDGNIKAMGEQVEEVTVDGNPFFGDDPKIATKNLPADVVDKVQVIDKKSDQAAFSGIDDGQLKKSINLKLKEDKKSGTFGNIAGAGGSQERFDAKVNANRFNGGDQLSLLANGNNLNEAGFSLQESLSFSGISGGGSGIRISMAPGGGPGAGAPGLSDGITTAWSGGLNFREQLNARLKSSGSYFFNHTHTANERQRERENLLGDGGTLLYQENGHSDDGGANHRLNLNFEYEIDSMSSLQVKPEFTYRDDRNEAANKYSTKSPGNLLLNSGFSEYRTSQQAPVLNTDLLYRRRFSVEGRTFSASFRGGLQHPEAEQVNRSENRFFTGSAADTVHQQQLREEQQLSGNLRLNYTEPVGRNKLLGIFYEWRRSRQESNRRTFDFNEQSGEFDLANELFTNRFENGFLVHEAGLQLQFQKLRYDLTLGAGARQSRIESVSQGAEKGFVKSFFNLFPTALFNYNFSTHRRLRLSYRTDTRPPAIAELQPVPDNRNPQYIQLGNPALKPEFAHRFRLNYHSFDFQSMRSLFSTLSVTATTNKIVRSNTIDETGRQVSLPVNASGAVDANGMAVLGIPLSGNRLKINLSTFLYYQGYTNFINEAENITRTWMARQRLGLSYDREEQFFLSLSTAASFNRATYSLQDFRDAGYLNYEVSLDVSWDLPVGLRLESELDYQVNAGGTALYNNRAVLWHATLEKDLFNKGQGRLSLQAFDLLNQNVSLSRNTGENYVEDVRNTVLGQYFLLRFAYRWGKFGGKFFPGPGGGNIHIRKF
jgi:hypothetical protein